MTFVDVVEKTLDVLTLGVLKPRDCFEIYNFGRRSSGVYTVYSGRTARRTEVYCDMSTDGGGWTVCIATNVSPSKCSVLFFSRPRIRALATPCTYFLHLSLSSVILIDSSTESPVHVLMLSIQAVRGLPRLRARGIVPCVFSFSRQTRCDHSMLASVLWLCLSVPSLLQLC